MAQKLQEKRNKSEFSERKRIDSEEAKKSERLNAISKKKEERLLEVKRDLEEKLRGRLIVKNSDLKKEAKEQERKFRNQKKSSTEKQMTQIRSEMKEIIEAGLENVKARNLISAKVKFDGTDKLTIGKVKYKLKNNVHMVGWGRESAIIGACFQNLIGEQLKKGFLILQEEENSTNNVKALIDNSLLPSDNDTVITYLKVGNDKETFEANKKIFDHCKKLRKTDILVVILSAGTDDLVCLPKGNIGVKEKIRFLSKMKNANATQEEINITRKKLSLIRGSGLARVAFPAKVITIIMSDVPGDNINEIAGAPTVNESSTINEVNAILHKYQLVTNLSLSMRQVLNESPPKVSKKMVNAKTRKFKFVDYHIIASNGDAANGMANAAFKLGYVPIRVKSSCTGPSRRMAQEYVKFASLMILAVEGKLSKLEFYKFMMKSKILPLTEDKVREIFPMKEKWGLGLYLILGGRVTMNDAREQTAPNQELALYFSIYWYLRCQQYPILKDYVVWFLGGASSGKDGNSKSAGAYGYSGIATGVWEYYQELRDLSIEVQLLPTILDPKENQEFMQLVENLNNEISKVRTILPDKILGNDTNFFFNNINNGEELLNILDNETDGNTFTNVGDLHLIRIVRYQCNCNGSCFQEKETKASEICTNNNCISNGSDDEKKIQCCGKIGSPKESI